MAVLEKFLKTKLPTRDELSKKILKGKLFTRRGPDPGQAGPPAHAAEATPLALPPQPAAAADKAKKPSLGALLQRRKKTTESSSNGPTHDRIARALRRSQMEAELAAMKPKRIFVSEPEPIALPVQAPIPPAPDPASASAPEVAPTLLSRDEAEALVLAITGPAEPEPAPAPKPRADPRSAALLALAIEAELDVTALAARVEQRTGLTPEIEKEGCDLRLSFPEITLVVSQIARPIGEAELLNLLYPDEQEWQAIQTQFASMSRHIVVGAVEPAHTLPDLRRRAVLIAETVVALLDLMPSCLGIIWPLGASLIDEGDFRGLSLALAEGLEAEAASVLPDEPPTDITPEQKASDADPAQTELLAQTPEQAQLLLPTQAKEPETPRA